MNKNDLIYVEDSDIDFEMLERALREMDVPCSLKRYPDSHSFMTYLTSENAHNVLPKCILLDLNLPGLNGHQLLQEIRKHTALAFVPVVILSTSKNNKDVINSYRNGANGYLVKPQRWEDYKELGRFFSRYWLQENITAHDELW